MAGTVALTDAEQTMFDLLATGPATAAVIRRTVHQAGCRITDRGVRMMVHRWIDRGRLVRLSPEGKRLRVALADHVAPPAPDLGDQLVTLLGGLLDAGHRVVAQLDEIALGVGRLPQSIPAKVLSACRRAGAQHRAVAVTSLAKELGENWSAERLRRVLLACSELGLVELDSARSPKRVRLPEGSL